VTNPDPVPPPSNAKPAWLPQVQYAMAGLFMLGAVFTGISGYKVFIIVAFVVDAGVIVWMMQQPWAKAMLRKR
jgi:hypothetical protein